MLSELRFPDAPAAATVSAWVIELRQALSLHGSVLIRGLRPGAALLHTLVHELSDPEGGSALTDALTHQSPAESAQDQAQRSSAMFALPLHRDGALVDQPSHLIAFAAFGDKDSDPSSYLDLVDSSAALGELSDEISTTLVNHALEYRVLERRPFPGLPEGWFTRPSFITIDGHRALNIILPVAVPPASSTPPWPTPWIVRFAGLSDELSQSRLALLEAELRTSSAFRRHHWVSGDVVIVDNARTLHGTSAVESRSAHHTIRASSSLRPPPRTTLAPG